MKARSGAKTAAIVLVSALFLVGLMILAYRIMTLRNDKPGITLPDASTPAEEQPPQEQQTADRFVTVDTTNVLDVLETLRTADSFYQQFTTTLFWGKEQSERKVEWFQARGIVRINVWEAGRKRCYLTDGNVLFLWYEGETEAAERNLDQDLSLEDLAGVPEYKKELVQAEILEASYLSSGSSEQEIVYVSAALPSGSHRQYWIDLPTGQLVQADIMEDQQLSYQVLQTSLEQAGPSDPIFEDAFCLPDGTEPFRP